MAASAVISGMMAGIVTLLAGPARFNMRGLSRDLSREIGMPVDVHDTFTLVTNVGAGQFDFFLQSLLIPVFANAKRIAELDYILACGDV